MTHFIDGRPERTERGHTKQCEATWLTAEELGKCLGNRSGQTIREALADMGYGCLTAKKPKPEAVKKGLVREYRHNGKRFYKWKRKEMLPILKEYYEQAKDGSLAEEEKTA